MKCCESPIISIVPKSRSEAPRSREAAAQFAALLMEAAFKPLAAAIGFYGDLVVGTAAQSVARAERGGLTDRLERALEANVRATSEPKR